jgi:hypothetical protein
VIAAAGGEAAAAVRSERVRWCRLLGVVCGGLPSISNVIFVIRLLGTGEDKKTEEKESTLTTK